MNREKDNYQEELKLEDRNKKNEEEKVSYAEEYHVNFLGVGKTEF